jgi:hypothetical protein
MDVTLWQEGLEPGDAPARPTDPVPSTDPELEAFRRQLEGLL